MTITDLVTQFTAVLITAVKCFSRSKKTATTPSITTLNITKLSITTFSIMTLSVMEIIVMLSVIYKPNTLSVVILNAVAPSKASVPA
jgi:hypothetical protein